MGRWIYGLILSTLGFLVVLVPACNQFSKVADKGREVAREIIGDSRDPVVIAPDAKQVIARDPSEIVIGTYNIQTFGVKKLANSKVMSTLVKIARQFDVLAIQEIRSRHDQTVVQQFIDMINSDGSRYNYVISPLLGTKSYTEQYCFIFDTTRIEMIHEGSVVGDPYDLLIREPMFSRFRTRTTNPDHAFTFTLANVHTTPNRVRHELTTLYEVYLYLQSFVASQWGEDDVIMLGDFNAPPRSYGQLWQIRALASALPEGVTTNAMGNHAYDNILFDRETTPEYTGKSGVLDLQQIFGLTRDEVKSVSDHLPVWAAFTAGEINQQPQYARQPLNSQGR